MLEINDEIRMKAAELEKDGRLMDEKLCLQHGKTTVYEHSLQVAQMSLRLAEHLHMKVDRPRMIRGALLHDYFLYDWHDRHNGHPLHGVSHPQTAYENAAQDYTLSDLEKDIITHHMFPLTLHPPASKEAWLVCMADKLCACLETLHRF